MKNTPNITLRPSQPQDMEQAVPLIYSSGPPAFDFAFCANAPSQSVAFLKSAFVAGDSEFGYHQHTSAVLDDQVVGIGGIRFAHQNFRFTLAAARAIFRFYSPLAALGVVRRGLQIERILPPPKRNVGVIYQLGVAPVHQSKGIGRHLLRNLIDKIEAEGMARAALDVAVTNPRAQALYEREGFSIVAKHEGKLKSAFGHVGDHYYMEYPFS